MAKITIDVLDNEISQYEIETENEAKTLYTLYSFFQSPRTWIKRTWLDQTGHRSNVPNGLIILNDSGPINYVEVHIEMSYLHKGFEILGYKAIKHKS